MAYKALVDNKVKQAFNLVKDLAVNLTLNKKESITFNFSSGETESTTVPATIIKGIPIDSSKVAEDKTTVNQKFLVKSKDVLDINKYATITYQNKVWNIGSVENDNTFTLVLNIYREA